MTREEQIKQAGKEHSYEIVSIRPNLTKDSFIAGAKWADKTMIDKACEWLWNEIYERINDSEIRESLYDDSYRANLVDAFREAMEE